LKGSAVVGGSGESTNDANINEQGARSEDLETTSTDLSELHTLLARARERLSFYEGFDRIIAENVRRSGELMLESLRVRDKLTTDANFLGAEERSRILRRLNGLDGALNTMQANLNDVLGQVADLRQSLTHAPVGDSFPTIETTPGAGTGSGDVDQATLMAMVARESAEQASSDLTGTTTEPTTTDSPPTIAPQPEPVAPAPSPAPVAQPAAAPIVAQRAEPVPVSPAQTPPVQQAAAPATPTPVPATPAPQTPPIISSVTEVWNEQRTIEVIAHDVTRAAVALALQGHLRSLPQVAMVDAREFASGMLRLQVAATASLSQADLTGWSGSEHMQIVQLQPTVVELRFNY
jgi:hypothetical protein